MNEARLIHIPENPLPEGMAARFLTAEDGVPLRIATLPALEKARGSILVMPGWAEYIEKYAEVAGELRERGF
ncbi:MAG: alpha/beta hydrolase, partial [Pseudomonadota bacterium]